MAGKNVDGSGGRSEDEHLSNVDDGCGCAEVWEHLSEQRAGDE
jgi:hypothetical protein